MRRKTETKSSLSVLFPTYPLGIGLGAFFSFGKMWGAVRVLHEERLACIETTNNVVLGGNHRSWADPFLVAALLSGYYGWHPLKYAPIIFADVNDFFNSPKFRAFKSVMVPVYREKDNVAEQLASAKRMLQAFADYPGRPKILFVEGGRTFKGEVVNGGDGRFSYGKHGEESQIRHIAEGVGSLIRTTESTVIPLGIVGSDRAFPNSKKHLLTRLVFGEKITISVGKPVKFWRTTSRETITQDISSQILEQLDEAITFSNANP